MNKSVSGKKEGKNRGDVGKAMESSLPETIFRTLLAFTVTGSVNATSVLNAVADMALGLQTGADFVKRLVPSQDDPVIIYSFFLYGGHRERWANHFQRSSQSAPGLET